LGNLYAKGESEMKISQLIKKLQNEQSRWGDIEVIAHAPNKPGLVVDVATFEGSDVVPKAVWISTEEAE
jgi:hypothetical protein